MAANVDPIFIKLPSNGTPAQFTNADTTAKKVIYTAGADASRLESISVSTDDTVAVNLGFFITVSGVDIFIGNVPVPANSGYTSTPRVDAIVTLAPIKGFITLGAGVILKCACLATMTAAKTTTVAVLAGGDY